MHSGGRPHLYSYLRNIPAFFFPRDYFNVTSDDFTAAIVGTQTKGEVFMKTEFCFLKHRISMVGCIPSQLLGLY